ncbi:hypothetical protein [uncultured Desulfobacter sp.]|uniref:hypothetical protein n=1 Tax=uncultured Desulfobacter sp. TaxID=240139 RepID=UPI0029F53A4E|nr:hypothetical protein [uncultured Desulfobacter sp.]
MIKPLIKKIVRQVFEDDLDELRILTAQNLIQFQRNITLKTLSQAEFKVFSQWGEDGIIQYLIGRLPVETKVFIEFGVENYKEANTRFLLMNDNWSGLVIDASEKNVNAIKKSNLYWKYDLTAKNIFITRDNIDGIIDEYIEKNELNKEIGLLSIDVDGVDYYLWEAIESIEPVIVICEYNWIFGNRVPVTVPYKENFNRTRQHYSNLYFGASIGALYRLAKTKGYEYIGCTSAGNDAFFVKRKYAEKYLNPLITSPQKVFNEQKAKESRNRKGKLTFVRGKKRFKLIESQEVLNLENNEIIKLKDLISDK